MQSLKTFCALLIVAIIFGFGLEAKAVTLSTNAVVRFVSPLVIATNQLPNFGSVATGGAGRVLTLDTNGNITNTNAADYMSGAAVGKYTVTGSSNNTVNISAQNYVANNNVIPSAATCAYNGGTANPCNLAAQVAPGSGKTLLVGITITTSGVSNDGDTANPMFDLVVTYN